MLKPTISIVLTAAGPVESALSVINSWVLVAPVADVILVCRAASIGIDGDAAPPGVRLVSVPGATPGQAWRAGIAAAHGTFVTFAESLRLPEWDELLSLAAALALHDRADVVYGDLCSISASGQRSGRFSGDLGTDPAASLRKIVPNASAFAFRVSAAAEVIASSGLPDRLPGWALLLRLAECGAAFRHDPRHVAAVEFPDAGEDIEALLTEGLAILSAGRSVPPAWSDGALAALHFAGRSISRGGDAAALLRRLGPDIPAPDAWDAARAVFLGLHEGVAEVSPDWVHLWPGFESQLAALWRAMAGRSTLPDWAELARVEIERRAASALPPGRDGVIGRTRVRRIRDDSVLHEPEPGPGPTRFIGLVADPGGSDVPFEVLTGAVDWRHTLSSVLREYIPPTPVSTVEPPPDPMATAEAQPDVRPGSDAGAGSESGDWEAVFAKEDPWDYDNPYEDLKYRQTLAALPELPGRVLELACAEGHFTRRLALLATEVHATDVSPTALGRARRACAAFGNVTFDCLDLSQDPIPTGFDVIVCSEVLYYLHIRDCVAAFADRIAAALPVGGHFVECHARVVGDEPSGYGFAWRHGFGARTIRDIFARTSGLQLVRDDVSDLYCVSVFRRVEDAAVGIAAPAIHRIPVTSDLPDAIRAQLAPGTPVNDEPRPGIPVLCYHRVTGDRVAEGLAPYCLSPEAFGAQMDWLSDAGFAPMTLAAFDAVVWHGAETPARSVLITFDDGYRDTLHTAGPILARQGFPATVFLPVDWVGQDAGWDAAFGPPAPLMSWAEVQDASRMGFDFASHGAAHLPFPALDRKSLADELSRSSDRIAEATGTRPRAVAYPYGAHDEASARATYDEGFRLGFTTRRGRWLPRSRVMAVPRFEIPAGTSISDFAEIMARG